MRIRLLFLFISLTMLTSCVIHSSFPFICFRKECHNQYSKKPNKKSRSNHGKKRGLKKVKKSKKEMLSVNKEEGLDKLTPKNYNNTMIIKMDNSEIFDEKSISLEDSIDIKKVYKDNIDSINAISLDTISKSDDIAKEDTQQEIYSEKIIIYFSFDKYNISQDDEERIKQYLKSIDLNLVKKIYVVGYTDNMGTIKYNEKLSLNRAKMVSNYIMKNSQIKATKIVVEGKGSLYPAAPNNTISGRSKNRRVEIFINFKK